MAGIIARGDWRGPNVLNGRIVTAGNEKDRTNDSVNMSAPILEAEYGD